MFGDLIPLPRESNCPQFTSPKVGQEQGATIRDASGFARGLSIITVPDRQTKVMRGQMHKLAVWTQADTRTNAS